MKPSLGRIVILNLTTEQRNFVNTGSYTSPAPENANWEAPAIIVKCDSSHAENSAVNLRVFCPGTGYAVDMTAKNVIQGTEIGQWHEPERI